MNVIRQREEIIDLLRGSPDGTVLFVGGRDTNFPEAVRSHSRCIFWDSTDPKTARKNQIPASVILVVLTRFITHALTNQLQKAIRVTKRKIMAVNAAGSLGLLCDIVAEGLDIKLKEASKAPPGNENLSSEAAARQQDREVDAFLVKEANLEAEDAVAEIARLGQLIIDRWKKNVNLGAIVDRFYEMRRAREEKPKPQRVFDLFRDGDSFAAHGFVDAAFVIKRQIMLEEKRLVPYVRDLEGLILERKRLSQKIQELTDQAKEFETRVAEAAKRERSAEEKFEKVAALVRQASVIVEA